MICLKRAISKDHILLARTSHQTCQIHISELNDNKKGVSKEGLLHKLRPFFPCNCKAGNYKYCLIFNHFLASNLNYQKSSDSIFIGLNLAPPSWSPNGSSKYSLLRSLKCPCTPSPATLNWRITQGSPQLGSNLQTSLCFHWNSPLGFKCLLLECAESMSCLWIQ